MVSTTSLRQLGFKAPRFRVSPDWAKSGDVNKVHWWPNILKNISTYVQDLLLKEKIAST